jgi:hypothetical protein
MAKVSRLVVRLLHLGEVRDGLVLRDIGYDEHM